MIVSFIFSAGGTIVWTPEADGIVDELTATSGSVIVSTDPTVTAAQLLTGTTNSQRRDVIYSGGGNSGQAQLRAFSYEVRQGENYYVIASGQLLAQLNYRTTV